LRTPAENVTTLTWEMENVGGSEDSQLWDDIGGSEKNRL